MSLNFKTAAKHLVTLVLSIVFLNGCANSSDDFVDKTSDGYRIQSARQAIDRLDFLDAIQHLELVYANRPDDREVKYLLSVAYAGRAGLRIIDLFEQVADKSDTKGVLRIFAEHFTGVTLDNLSDLKEAVSFLESISTEATERTDDENFYALFLYYAQIGALINYSALDPDDNSLRSNFRSCHTVVDFDAVKTGITSANIDTITVDLLRILQTAATLTVEDDLESLVALSGVPSGLDLDSNCAAQPNQSICKSVRTVVGVGHADDGIGVGTSEGTCLVLTP